MAIVKLQGVRYPKIDKNIRQGKNQEKREIKRKKFRLLNYLLNPAYLAVVKLYLYTVRVNRCSCKYLLHMSTGKFSGTLVFSKLNHDSEAWSDIFSARSFHFSCY